jgi:hypothetical protein
MATRELDILADTTDDATGLEDTTTDTNTGERLYDYTPPRETGGSQNLYWGNYSKQVTLDDLEAAYYAKDNARTREAFGSWDNYLAYMNERQDLIEQGDYKADWWDTGVALTDPEALGRESGQDDRALEMDIMQEGARQGEIGYSEQEDVFTNLYEKYTGESVVKTLDNGAKYEWNGSGFVMTQEAFGPHIGSMLGAALPGIVLSAGLAGPLSGLLQGAGLSSSAAAAASQTIINGATQLAATGKIDIKQALISGAIAYGGAELGEIIKGSTELDGVLGDITSAAKDTVSKFQELVETNIPIADAAIQAGGISMLTQLVTTGEVDLKQAALAAVIAGGKEAFNQFKTDMNTLGVPEDEYMADLAEYEEFQQAAINADIKDPFLNPNYTTVGDGLMVNAAGNVFNYAGDNLGNMSTLDTNNDGKLSGVDLQEITTDVTAKNIYNYQMDDPVYVDENGVPVDPKLVRFGPDGYVGYDAAGNQVTVTQKYYDEVFGGGKGDLIWTSEGGTDGYISYENGELAYKKVEGQWVDAQGNVVEDPQTVDELTMIAAKAIDAPLESVTYFDQSGTAINYKYPPAGLQDNFEQGQFSGLIYGPNGEISEVWYDPQTNTEYVRAQGTTEITAIRTPDTPPETVETKTTTTDTTQTTTAGEDGGGVEVVSTAVEDVAGAGTSQEVSTAINNAVNQGVSSSALSAAINAALLAGTITPEQAAAAYDSIGTIDITTTADGVPVDAGSEVAVDTTTGGGLLTGGVTTGGVDTSVFTTTGANAGTVTGDVTGGVTGGDVTGGTTTEGEVTTGGTAATDTSGTGGSDVVDAGVVGTVVAGTVTGSEDPGAGSPGTDGQDGTGSGDGNGDGDTPPAAAASRNMFSYNPAAPYGLSYQAQPVPGVQASPMVDYAAGLVTPTQELDGLIARLMNNRLFEDFT